MKGQEAFDYQLAIMQAIKDGKEVQIKGRPGTKGWTTREPTDSWFCYLNFKEYQFRIKPEPIEQEYWHFPKLGNTSSLYKVGKPETHAGWLGAGWVKIKMREVLDDES